MISDEIEAAKAAYNQQIKDREIELRQQVKHESEMFVQVIRNPPNSIFRAGKTVDVVGIGEPIVFFLLGSYTIESDRRYGVTENGVLIQSVYERPKGWFKSCRWSDYHPVEIDHLDLKTCKEILKYLWEAMYSS